MEKQLFRNTIRVGNSAGVLLPKEWLNGQVKVELIEKPIDIKKDVFRLIDPYLEDILGVYLVGSYARGDKDKESDIDVMVFSNELKKEIKKGKYNISIYPMKTVELASKNNPLTILPRIFEAKALLNKGLLEQFKKIKLNKDSFKTYLESTKRIMGINKGLFDLDETLSENNIYSLILRLRGFYMISSLLKKQPSTKEGFKSFLISEGLDYKKLYRVYQDAKADKNKTFTLGKEESLKLLNCLEKQIKKYDKS
jgi:predicted nucleotidyltransferase